jgi:DNA ligase-1
VKFARFVEFLEQLEATPSRLKMIEILGAVFAEAEPAETDKIVYLSQGRVAPAYEKMEFGVAENLTAGAIAQATGEEVVEIKRRYARLGDYGKVAAELLPALDGTHTVGDIFDGLCRIAQASGSGAVAAKTGILAGLLRNSDSREARYLLGILLGRLRIGIGDPTVMDALSLATAGNRALRPVIERAYNVCSDLGLVGRILREQGVEALEAIHVTAGKPVRPALAERESSAEAIIARLGRCAAEPKFDGFRCQVHKIGDEIHVFSRNLEDFSDMFPEIIEATRAQSRFREAIFEGEAMAYDPATGDYLPFQVTMSRRRKYDIELMREQVPLKLIIFDLLYVDGRDLTPQPYEARRETLREILGPSEVLEQSDVLVTDVAVDLERFFHAQITAGLEGIVCKRLDAEYKAGKRDFRWIKLKRSYQGHLSDTVDTVIVGYWYGKGHRARFGIGSLLIAVYDAESDQFYTVSRVATGFSEQEWYQIKPMLDEIRTDQVPHRLVSMIVPDVWCEPKYVVEIQADEITRSPMHTAGQRTNGEGKALGYALRFPRTVDFVRPDKQPEDVTTVAEIVRMHQLQGKQTIEASNE